MSSLKEGGGLGGEDERSGVEDTIGFSSEVDGIPGDVGGAEGRVG